MQIISKGLKMAVEKIEDMQSEQFDLINLLIYKEKKIDRLKQRNGELEAELKVADKLLETRNELLKFIPACEAHGDQCVPHALEWISKVKTLAKIIAG